MRTLRKEHLPMDGRRFDGFARVYADGRSRRGVLRGLAGLTAAGLFARTRPVAADGDDGTGIGGATDGTTGSGTCVPVSRPTTTSYQPPFSALIVAGSCETPNFDTTYSLFDIAAESNPVGSATAAAVYQSTTTVRVAIDDLVKQSYSVVVRGSDDETVIACGEIGGVRVGDDLTVGVRERNGSNYTGFAWVRGNGESSLIYVFLGRGLSTVETGIAAEGSTVVTTVDVNLRAEASEEADIVALLPEGTELTVTGAADGTWVPVENPETGDEGFVAAEYLILQE
jgi:hypothetical protein